MVENSEDGVGFWNSARIESYANPMMVRFCKELWRRFPTLYLFAECPGGVGVGLRQGVVARSGPIPRLYDLPRSLARVWGKKLKADGSLEETSDKAGVRELHRWFRSAHRFLPGEAIVASSSTSHFWPLPALLYGRGAWAAVDVLFFLPDVPFTFMGEERGKAYRIATATLFQSF